MSQEGKSDTLRFRVSVISILLLLLSIFYVFVFDGGDATKTSQPAVAVESKKNEPTKIENEPVVAEVKEAVIAPVVEAKTEPVKAKEEAVVEVPVVVAKPEVAVVPVVDKPKEEPVIIVVPEENRFDVVVSQTPNYQKQVEIELVDVTPAPIIETKPTVAVVEKPEYRYAYSTHFWFNGKLFYQKVQSAVDLQQYNAARKPDFSEYLNWQGLTDYNEIGKSIAKLVFETDYPSEFQSTNCNCEQHKHRVTLADECALVNVCLVNYQSRNELKPVAKINLLRNLKIALSGLHYIQSDTQLQKWVSEISSEIIQLEVR